MYNTNKTLKKYVKYVNTVFARTSIALGHVLKDHMHKWLADISKT